MELKIDLLKIEKKSVFRIILGIGFLVLFILWISEKSKGNYLFIGFLDWVVVATMLFNGIIHTLGGFGFSISHLFGKAYIHIDEQSITIKMRLFEKEQHFEWSDIKAMDYMANKYRFTMKDGTTGILNLSKMEYLLKKEVKTVIVEIALGKGVLIS